MGDARARRVPRSRRRGGRGADGRAVLIEASGVVEARRRAATPAQPRAHRSASSAGRPCTASCRRRSRPSRAGSRSTPAHGRPRGPGAVAAARPEAAQRHRGAARAPAAPRRVRAHRRAHVAARGRERVRLLHVLPRAREGLVLEGHARQARARSRRTRSASRSRGCPLDEKIGEMHVLRKGGDSIAALAMVVVDNPMLPGTGHRICNDCMKACIFQKQEPVNIPQTETGVLTDVLGLPWGFEIYGLLTRWNPLNRARPFALPYNGKNVLVVGLGPAGYTLSQHLLNDGFGVVGDRRPQDRAAARGSAGRRRLAAARGRELERARPRRSTSDGSSGFGGVAEYGITVRWDKNFLTALHLTLARRRDLPRLRRRPLRRHARRRASAFAMGFDHVAIAAGAGKPTIIDVKNNLIRGVRKACDFLMALQLTGAFKKRLARQPAGAPAGARHRRRPDRHRHGDRGGGLLPGPGREVPRALGGAVAATADEARWPQDVRCRGARGRARVPRARPRRARRARARRGRGRGARLRAARRTPGAASRSSTGAA